MTKKAVILVSGGLDSATTLAIACEAGYDCYAMSFNYGQRHQIELESAKIVSSTLGAKQHKVVHLGLDDIGGSAISILANYCKRSFRADYNEFITELVR